MHERGGNREKHASIRKFGPEIKNRCTQEGLNGEKLASIRKSGPEIKSRCSRGLVAVCRRNHSLLPQRRMVPPAAVVAAAIFRIRF